MDWRRIFAENAGVPRLQQEIARKDALIAKLRAALATERAWGQRQERLRREAEDAIRTAQTTRADVLRQQALRARLAKTDMRPAARLRTLQAVEQAGLELTAKPADELRDLELELEY